MVRARRVSGSYYPGRGAGPSPEGERSAAGPGLVGTALQERERKRSGGESLEILIGRGRLKMEGGKKRKKQRLEKRAEEK